MDRVRRKGLIVLCCIIQIWAVVGDVGQDMEGKPVYSNLLKDTLSTIKKSHQNYWAKLKTIVRYAQLKFFPPNLDFKSQGGGGGGGGGSGGASEKVKEAAEKSFETTKNTAHESAKTVAKVVEKTVHKAKDKLSDDDSPHDDL